MLLFLGFQCTLMKDPVILPSSRVVVDRPVIQRHLLSDAVRKTSTYLNYFSSHVFSWKKEANYCLILEIQTDPFNRSHLTADMLIPDVELKAKIEEFVKSQELRRRGGGGEGLSMQNAKDKIQTTDTTTLID